MLLVQLSSIRGGIFNVVDTWDKYAQCSIMSDVVQKLSPTHEQMILWVMTNPGGTLREMSAAFGYTVPWLCQVVNSDMFKAALAQKMQGVEALVVADIPAKLRGVASLAVDRMAEVLQRTDDSDTIIDAFDKVMHRYGYAPNAKNGAQAGAGGTNIQNNFYLSREEFKDVQGQLIESHAKKPSLPSPAPEIPEDVQLVPSS